MGDPTQRPAQSFVKGKVGLLPEDGVDRPTSLRRWVSKGGKRLDRVLPCPRPPDRDATRACGRGSDAIHPWAEFDQEDEILEMEIGAIVAATGYEVKGTDFFPEYGYGEHPDILTGLQFERLASASGPTLGVIKRPSDGKVPDTVCACYHYFPNLSCCERVDCVVPPGTSGQICPASQGQLCDHCSPLKPECVEPGARCIVTNAHETFCGRDCANQPCPAGYTCMTIKLKAGTTQQCVPSDMSCYY